MRTKTTFGVSFFVKKHLKDSNNEVPVYLRVTVNIVRRDISLKRKIPIEYWDMKNNMVKGRKEESQKLKMYLDTIKSLIYDSKEELEKERKPITSEGIKNRFLKEDDEGYTILQMIDYHNQEMKFDLRPGTQKNYYTTKKYVERFIKQKYKRSDLYLEELDYNFVKNFERYIRSIKPKGNLKACGQNTIMKHIERLKKVVNLAIKEGKLEKNPFSNYKAKFVKVKRGYLTKEELDRIELKEINVERIALVRDLFVFACYTGLSYADVTSLKADDISRDDEGNQWIDGRRKKSDEFFTIPLLPKAEEILNNYNNNPRFLYRDNALLPYFSNQKMNAYLKEIADLCNIKKNLTFHLARHTFATTVTLTNGVPLETVSKMLGHTSLKTTQIYAEVIKTKVRNDMNHLKEKLKAN